jgi:hypothetical protein
MALATSIWGEIDIKVMRRPSGGALQLRTNPSTFLLPSLVSFALFYDIFLLLPCF